MGEAGERAEWIDLAKFFGVTLVVMSHVGLRIPLFGFFTGAFYVPVFFLLSGFTYHGRQEGFSDFVKRKGKRLLLPYFGWSFFLYIFYLIKDVLGRGEPVREVLMPLVGIFISRYSLYAPGQRDNLLFMNIWNSPLWFLTALFLSLVLFEICVRVSGGDERKLLAGSAFCFGVGLLLPRWVGFLLPWSLDTAFLFEGMIYIGYLLGRNSWQAMGKRKTAVMVLLAAVLSVTCYCNGVVNVSVGDFGRYRLVGVVNAVLSSMVVLWFCFLCRNHVPGALAAAGRSSLTIMCLHLFVYLFVKTGFDLVLPGVLDGNGPGTVLGKAVAVCMILVILTIVGRWFQGKGKRA